MTWYSSRKLRLPLGPTWAQAPAWTDLIMSDSARRVAGIMQLPPGQSSYVLTRAACRIGLTAGTVPTYRISIQGVSATGLPDGTVKGGGTPASATFTPVANTEMLISLANSYTAAPGEWIAIVVDYSSGTIDGSNNARIGYVTSSANDGALQPYGLDFQTSWTKRNEHGPFVVGTATELFGEAVFRDGLTPVFANASNPNEYGICFTVPSYYSHIRISGFQFVPSSMDANGLHTVSLYEGGGASDTTVLASYVLDSDTVQNNRRAVVLFDSTTPIELVGGQSYRLAIRPNSTQSARLQFVSVSDVALWDATPLEQSSCYTTRAGGNWTDTVTRKMPWALLVREVELASGGGASFPPIGPGGLVY